MDDPDKDVVAENIGAALRFGVLPDSALVERKLAQAPSLAILERTGSSGVGIRKPMCVFQGG